MSDIELIFFDMDGTLLIEDVTDPYGSKARSVWSLIANHLGDDASKREQEARQKCYDREYRSPRELLEDVLEIFREGGLCKDYFYEVVGSIEYFPGVPETFDEVNERGYKTAVISGGFKAMAEKVAEDLKIDYVFAACELLWGHDGYLTGWNLFSLDYKSKLSYAKEIINECGVDESRCAFFGNGNNDVYIAEWLKGAGGISVALNGSEKLQNVCSYAVNQLPDARDFRAVLKYIL
ncbi:MAG: HAD-IB family phosphatase [archaeon]|nr:HAD-IB family phosphatase [archaeon]